MRNTTQKVLGILKKAFESDLYILFLCTAVLAGWIFGCWVEMILVMLAFTAIGTLLTATLKPLISFLVLCAATMGNQTVTDKDILLIFLFSLAVVGALIANLVIYKRNWTVLHPKKIKGYTLSHLLLIIPFLFAGVGSKVGNKNASLVAAGLVILITLLYLLLYVGAKRENGNFTNYLVKCVLALSVITSLEFILAIIRIGNVDAIIANIINKTFWIGWTGPNTTGCIISLGIPCALSLCIKKRDINFLVIPACVFIAFLEFALVILSGSRGSILFLVMILPTLLLYAMWKTESKPTFIISMTVVFWLFALLILKFNKLLNPIIISILQKGMSSSNRIESIYPEAVQLFKDNPVFGAGWGYKLSTNLSGLPEPYFFHSTFYQFLANMGIVGILFLAIFFMWRYMTVIPMRKNFSAIALTASVFLFDAYSLIDTSFFNPILFIVSMLMILSIELDMPNDRCLAFGIINKLKFFKRKPLNESKTTKEG